MKKMMLVILFVCAQVSLYAKCAFSGIYPTLANTVVDCSSAGISTTMNLATTYKNSLILLEFYGVSQDLVEGLNKKYPIYLKSGNEEIILQAQEVLRGEFQLTQVVFKPATVLTEGRKYELVIKNLPKHQQAPVRYNSSSGKWEPISYMVIKSTGSTPKLLFNETPKEIKKTLTHYGCGPAKWVYYELKAENDIPVYVKTFVKNLTTGKTTSYYLAVENNMVQVGHGMCSGAFTYDPENLYEVSFMLMDQAGNNSQQTAFQILKQPDRATESE